jgi:hypothetical protein
MRVCLQIFFLNHFQHFHSDRAGDVVTAKRAEVFHAVVE